MKYFTLFVFLAFAFISCSRSGLKTVNNDLNNMSKVDQPPPSKPGSCYANAEAPDITIEVEEPLFLFMGNVNNTEVEIEEVSVMVYEGGKKWVKEKVDKDCLSDIEDDCLVWSLVDVPTKYRNFTIVVDTSATDQYQVYHSTLIKDGGPGEWVEIVCANKMTKELIAQVQRELFAADLYVGSTNGVMSPNLMGALANYQRLQSLPIGHFDFKTLDALGIDR